MIQAEEIRHEAQPHFKVGPPFRQNLRKSFKNALTLLLESLHLKFARKRMAQYSPRHAAYTALRSGVQEFRLLTIDSAASDDKIRCKIDIHEFAGCPPYEALSYAWGDTDCSEEIYLNGAPFKVTKNLFVALSHLRRRAGSTHLWIDAICIDQSSMAEKNHQVALMGMIYSGAEQVLIWVGEESDNSQQAIDLIERWYDGICTSPPGDPDDVPALTNDLRFALASIERPFDEADINAVSDLLNRAYWSRIWIVQEIVLGRSRTILCGDQELRFDKLVMVQTLWTFIMLLNNDSWCNYEGAGAMLVQNFRIHPSLIFINEIIRHHQVARREQMDYKADICYLLYNFRFSLATDSRDKIFGILGLLGANNKLIDVNYSLTLGEVCRAATVQLITEHKGLNVIGWRGVGTKDPEAVPVDPAWPSWVPNFAKLERMNFSHSSMMFQASKGRSATCDFPSSALLRVAAVTCDEVMHVSERLDPASMDGGDLSWIWSWLKIAEVHRQGEHPTKVPWRQAFFRTLISDEHSTGYNKPEFESEKDEQDFLAKAEGFITCMRMLALNKIRLLDREQNPPGVGLETFLSCEIHEPLDIYKAAELGIIDKEAALWILISSKTADDALRRRILETFCDAEASSNRLKWPFDEYGCTPQSFNFNLFASSTRPRARGSSFFITQKGYFGIGPGYVNVNDRVCVVLGAPAPIIVRKASNHHAIVGDAYVFGMMLGEMMDLVDEGKLVVEDLIIE